MEHRTIASESQRLVRIVTFFVVMAISASMIGLSGSPAEASNSLSDTAHWKRLNGQSTIFLTLRNQIGPGVEVGQINLTLARWGSTNASSYWPAGPARTDFSFAYKYGGAASCNLTSPYRTITFCLGDADGFPGLMTYSFWPGSNHYLRTWIEIHDHSRNAQWVYCQEFGHSLGLYHLANTCMGSSVIDDPRQHNLDWTRIVNSGTHIL